MRLLPGFVMVLVLMMTSAAGAATFNVDSQVDSPDATLGDGVCASKAGGCTLRAAVEEANASSRSSTINLPEGTYTLTSADEGANFGQSGVLLLGGVTTVAGAGLRTTVVNGDGKHRLFEVGNKATVTISGLTLREAQVQGGDGAALLNRGNLTVSNVLFLQNRAVGDPLVPKSGRGAALFNTNGGTASLNSVVALKNSSDGKGGAFFNDEASTLKIMNGEILGNQSLADSGGGISNSGTLEVTISTIRGNQAMQAAGGLDNIESSAKLLDVEITENTAGSEGGGLRSSGELSGHNLTVSENKASSAGGILARAPGKVSLNNVTVGDNQGGGLAAEKGATLAIANTLVARNETESKPTDCSGQIQSGGFNLIENPAGCQIRGNTTGNLSAVSAELGKLALNDGQNRTQALGAGSAAIDAGSPAKPGGPEGSCLIADQRGVRRPQAVRGDVPRCDIGAFENKGS
jgi:hypothetical protein